MNDNMLLNDLSIDRESNKKIVVPIPYSNWTVDNRGVVYTSRGRPARVDIQWDGSMRVLVTTISGQRWRYINEIVLNSFGYERPSYRHRPWHCDGDRSNNRLDNLSWQVLTTVDRRSEDE